MNDNTTLVQQMVAVAPATSRNVNLSTDPKQMAIIKVWDAMFRGARKYVEAKGFIGIYNIAFGQP